MYFIQGPYIDTFDEHGEPHESATEAFIWVAGVGDLSKRDAIRKKNEIMARVNRTQVVLQAQIPFGQLLDYYLEQFVRNPEKLAASTRAKYENHIENHIRDAWKDTPLCEIRGLELDTWLTEKGKPRLASVAGKDKIVPGLSWNTRTDLRNLMSGIFTKASDWGLWKGENPVKRVSVGKKKSARQHRKLTTEETRTPLEALPPGRTAHIRKWLSCIARCEFRRCLGFSGSILISRKG